LKYSQINDILIKRGRTDLIGTKHVKHSA